MVYVSIIHSLKYAIDCAILEFSYVKILICMFISWLVVESWHTIDSVMRSIKRTINSGLNYKTFMLAFKDTFMHIETRYQIF